MKKVSTEHRGKIAAGLISLGLGCYLYFLGKLVTMKLGLMGVEVLPGENLVLLVVLGILPLVVGLGVYLMITERKLDGMERQIKETNFKELKVTCDRIDNMGNEMLVTCDNINNMGNEMITLAKNIEYELQPIGEIADMANTMTSFLTRMPVARVLYGNLHRGVEYDRIQKEHVPQIRKAEVVKHDRS